MGKKSGIKYLFKVAGTQLCLQNHKVFSEFLLPNADVAEHLKAQLARPLTVEEEAKSKREIEPIYIGVTGEKFENVKKEIKRLVGHGDKIDLFWKRTIPIYTDVNDFALIVIVNEDALVKEQK